MIFPLDTCKIMNKNQYSNNELKNNFNKEEIIICKSISPEGINIPYEFQIIGNKVYSLEGLIYYCYSYWEETIYEFIDKSFVKWIKEELKLENIYIELIKIYETNMALSDKYVSFLSLINIFTTKELNTIREKIDTWENEPKEKQYKKLGDTFLRLKEYNKAINWYEKAQSIKYSYKVDNNISIAYISLSLYDKAKEYLEKAYNNSSDIIIKLNIIKLKIIKGNVEEALHELQIILLYNDSYEVWIQCGKIYKELKDFEKSLTAYLRAYEIIQTEKVLIEIITNYIEIGQYNKANRELENLKKDNVNKYYYLKSKILVRENDIKTAIRYLENTVNKNSDVENYIMLSKLYRDNNQIIKAIENISIAHSIMPNDNEILYNMALIAKKARKYNEYYEKVNTLVIKLKKEYRNK